MFFETQCNYNAQFLSSVATRFRYRLHVHRNKSCISTFDLSFDRSSNGSRTS